MQVTKSLTSDTQVKLEIAADAQMLATTKEQVVAQMAKSVRLPGFREGKAPANLVEKQLNQQQLQTQFLEQAVNDLYVAAVQQEKVRPTTQPQVNVTKFVPFETLEITAEVEAVGQITLPSYKKLGVKKTDVKITEKQVADVLEDLRERTATREEVTRAAKKGDEVVIDFAGTDPKTKDPIQNTDGKDYPLMLGSGNFIPGFEEELLGLKAGEEKSFDITFPEDYAVKDMQKKKVTFAVTVKSVQAIKKPAVDEAVAKQIGNFKTVDELKADVKDELTQQATAEADKNYESELLETLAKKTKVALPPTIVDEELDRLEQQERQNVMYRGQTWEEHLKSEGVTEAEHREKHRDAAELRVKSGLILGEIADAEDITVTPEDLEIRIQLLKGRYANDEKMQAELDKSENRRDIYGRLMTEKTLDKLKSLQ